MKFRFLTFAKPCTIYSPAEHSIREDRDQLKLIKNIYENQLIKQRKNVFFNDVSAGQYKLSSGLYGDLPNLIKIDINQPKHR